MEIECPGGVSSAMSVDVVDNSGNPISILQSDEPTTISVTWAVPPGFAGLIGGRTFRLRAYAESIGPGQEVQLGADENVTAVLNQEAYNANIAVNANALLGEGELYPPPPAVGGVPVSGIYKIVAVLQLLDGTAGTDVSGFAETDIRLFRIP